MGRSECTISQLECLLDFSLVRGIGISCVSSEEEHGVWRLSARQAQDTLQGIAMQSWALCRKSLGIHGVDSYLGGLVDLIGVW